MNNLFENQTGMHKGDYAALKINLIYCELLFQNQQYQGGKNWGYTENFMLLAAQISELLYSVLEILSF